MCLLKNSLCALFLKCPQINSSVVKSMSNTWYVHKGCIPYSGFLSREKTFANFAFLCRFAKVFTAKIYFQSIRYRASGRGALGYCKFAKVFSTKIYFQAIRETFLPRKTPAMRCILESFEELIILCNCVITYVLRTHSAYSGGNEK